MRNDNAMIWDRVKLVLSAVAVIGFMLEVMSLLDRVKGLAYILALLFLLVWPFVALWLVRLRGVISAAFAYSIYILLLAYLVGHALPFRVVSGWLDNAGHDIMQIALWTVFLGWLSGKLAGGSKEQDIPIQTKEV